MSRLTKNLRSTKFSPPEPDELQHEIEANLDLLLKVADNTGPSIYPRQAEEYLILSTKLGLLLKQLEEVPNSHAILSRLESAFETDYRQKHLQLLTVFTENQQTPLEWCSAQLLATPGDDLHLKLIEKYFRKFSTKLAFQNLLVALRSKTTEQRIVKEIVENDPKLMSYRIMVELADLHSLDQQIAKVEAVFLDLPTIGVEVLLNTLTNKQRVAFPHHSSLILNALFYRLERLDEPLALLLTKIADNDELADQFYELLADEDIYDKFENFISTVIDWFQQTRVYIAPLNKWCAVNDPTQPNSLFAVVSFANFLRFVHLFVRPKSPVRQKFARNVLNEQKLGAIFLEIEMLFQNFD